MSRSKVKMRKAQDIVHYMFHVKRVSSLNFP